jgi:hypothetical protein
LHTRCGDRHEHADNPARPEKDHHSDRRFHLPL